MKNRKIFPIPLIVLLGMIGIVLDCSKESKDVLAPYMGDRVLDYLAIRHGYKPEIQWLGGRVAAVGVNKGEKAVLDKSLVWLMTNEDNSIESFIRYGLSPDLDRMNQFESTLYDSLVDDSVYTFWMAEKYVFDSGLDSSQFNVYNFADTTLTLDITPKGRAGGEQLGRNLVVTINFKREEGFLANKYTIEWEPSNIPFRQIVIREGSFGSFEDRLWHIFTPENMDDNIFPPVVIGEVPEGAVEAIPWPGSAYSLKRDQVHFIWMTNKKWTEGDFSTKATGYATFQLFPLSY